MKNIVIIIVLLLVTSCTKPSFTESYPKLEQQLSNNNPSIEKMRIPETGDNNQQYDNVIIDYSNTNLGYLIVKSLTQEHNKYKLGISFNGEILYYDINIDEQYICYPLSFGNGSYNIKLYENISETNYAVFGSLNLEVELDDKLLPYLYPNVISNYNENTKAVQASFEIIEGSINDLERVSMIFDWVIENIDYDYDKLEQARKTFLIPDVDLTYTSKKGICFDYSALMCAMLRPLNIPTKLVTGYVEQGYHAWVEVYIEDIGWIDPEIYFKSEIWTLMDPTFGSTNFSYKGDYEAVKDY